MRCPFCGYTESRVIDSRESPDGIRRRRECTECGHRFTTYERVHSDSLLVVKRDGRREPFETAKLHRSILIACAKRPLGVGTVEKLVGHIETELQKLSKAEVESRVIGEMVMDRLREIDRVAYIRFASVYRDFDDIDTFAREVEALQSEGEADEEPSNQLTLIPDDVPRRGAASRRRRASRVS